MVHKIYSFPHNQGVFYLICQITVTVMKEYNIKHHYTTKHSSQFDKIIGQARGDKIEYLKKSIKRRQGVFTTYKKDSELVTKLSFKLCECIAEKRKAFQRRNLLKILW